MSNELSISRWIVSLRRGANLNEVVMVLNAGVVAIQVLKILKQTSYVEVYATRMTIL